MNILVLADTHMPRMARGLPTAVAAALAEADLVLHAGDLCVQAVLAEIERYAPVVAVAGNNDEPALVRALPDRTVVDAGPFRIGLVHGHDGKGANTPSRALAAFTGQPVHCVVFGHSHQPLTRWEGGCLLFNPGSPTDRRRQPQYSFGWLRVGERIEPEIVRFGGTAER